MDTQNTQAAGLPKFLLNRLEMTVSERGEITLSRPDGQQLRLDHAEAERLRQFMDKTSSVRRAVVG